ncbi:MAG TPA: hypothetical protein VD969_00835 [Symbiobacteriaceae bacterium]|nr:hypothetical protein [Symbiobacteriaceae bacterium]
MQMPMPMGAPVPLPAQVTGSLSRLQGQLQAANPAVQNAYALHWLAMREAGFVPEFQRFTQHMLWGAYGTLALNGLLRHALSGRATPEVMAGVVDQLNLLQEHYGGAAQSLREFLQRPEAQDFAAVGPMVAAMRPLDTVYQAVQQPAQAVMGNLRWRQGPLLDLPQIRAAVFEQAPQGGEAGAAAE